MIRITFLTIAACFVTLLNVPMASAGLYCTNVGEYFIPGSCGCRDVTELASAGQCYPPANCDGVGSCVCDNPLSEPTNVENHCNYSLLGDGSCQSDSNCVYPAGNGGTRPCCIKEPNQQFGYCGSCMIALPEMQ